MGPVLRGHPSLVMYGDAPGSPSERGWACCCSRSRDTLAEEVTKPMYAIDLVPALMGVRGVAVGREVRWNARRKGLRSRPVSLNRPS